jgi:pimeloyl-ACP methyl ester carboxylesterase
MLPLLLLPAMLCDARLWRAQAESLARERAVTVAPTHLAASVGEAAAQTLDAAPRVFALAGLGLGGAIALEILRRAPERVVRLALMAADALAETPQAAAAREPLIVAAKAGRFADAVKAQPGFAALAPGPARPRVQAEVLAMAEALGPDAFVRGSRLLQRRPDQQRTLRQFKGATLILAGAHDTAFPPKRQEFLAELIPGARLEIVAEAGHLAPLEAPEAVLDALRRWLS